MPVASQRGGPKQPPRMGSGGGLSRGSSPCSLPRPAAREWRAEEAWPPAPGRSGAPPRLGRGALQRAPQPRAPGRGYDRAPKLRSRPRVACCLRRRPLRVCRSQHFHRWGHPWTSVARLGHFLTRSGGFKARPASSNPARPDRPVIAPGGLLMLGREASGAFGVFAAR